MDDITTRIDKLLNEWKISKAELSRQIDIPVTTIKNWVNNGAMPSAEAAYKVAKYLGVTVEWLVNGDPLQFAETVKPYETYSEQERALIDVFRHLDERDKNAVVTLAESLESQYSNSKIKNITDA